MKEKHIVLRVTGANTRDSRFLGAASLAAPSGLSGTGLAVDLEEIEDSDIPRVTQNRDVIAVAPAMPMKLIKPFDEPNMTAANSGAGWGVHAVGADSSPFTGDGVVVSVLDTGIDRNHSAFSGITLVERNFTKEPNGSDQHGHGTHCAGTIFGRDVNGVRIGVAPGVRKALIGKVLGAQGGPSDQIVQAIQWAATEGANVISMSLGMDFPGLQKQLEAAGFPPELATSRALEGYRLNVLLFEKLAAMVKALGELMQTTTILVAAAGNESKRQVKPDFRIAVSPPAVCEGIVSVAALGQDSGGFVVAPFSNTGAMVSGPGVGITSAKLGGGLAVMSGTSMATPHVAGVAALWAQKQKSLGPLTAPLLFAKVVGSGDTGGLKKPFDNVDIGSGIVRAPQS